MNSAELLVRCLENEGIEYCFGLPGEENLEFLKALTSSSIKTVITRDERGASFMANAYGRFTGKAGLCFSTLGPGATNLVTGIADAQLDFAPLVAITAQASSSRRHKESHQYIDVLSMLKAITKWNVRIDKPQIINEAIRKAFAIAEIEKPGPTHIELPEDIADMQVEEVPIRRTNRLYPICPEEQLKRAIEIINDSRLPMIIAGHGVIRNGASNSLIKFAEKAGIAVVTTFMGMGAIPADHELFVSNIGLQARDYVQCGIDKADLIIAIGYDPVEFSPKWWDRDKNIIHIDTNPSEIDRNYQGLEITGDMVSNLNRLTSLITQTKDFSYFSRLKLDVQSDFEAKMLFSTDNGISPLYILNSIRNVLKRDDILISDVGAHKIWIGRSYPAYEPNTVIISNGFASMGFALPSAITAKLLYPEKNIVVAVGDGGLMMSIAELETAMRLKLAFTIVIFNDNGYGLIQWKQLNRYNKDFFVNLTNPDFVKLAHAFGCKGYLVEKEGELLPTLKEAIGQQVPSIVECKVDYSINRRLSERLGSIICKV
ncbi:MAG: acetolactate synthase large subunit [Thermodesulfovibrionales bacterium]|nr:acetolactate synthase large subunit [Thermodesulfovibrionales bacterium]